MNDTSNHELLLSVAGHHGLSGTSVLSADELKELPQNHGVPVEGIRGKISIEGKLVSLSLALRFTETSCLPLIFMQPWDAFGVIPHIETDGFVCYAQSEGLLLDPNRFEQMVSTALNNAIVQIQTGARKENTPDFIDEFLPYWNRQKKAFSVSCFIEPRKEPKIIHVCVEDNIYRRIFDREADVRSFLSGSDPKQLTQRNALYVSLPVGTVIVPPHPHDSWSPTEATTILSRCLDSRATEKVAKLCRKLTKREELVVVHLPRKDGNNGSLFGLKFEGVQNTHPLAGGPAPARVTPVALLRYDRSFLSPRGGANNEIHGKKVLVVGCGAVGGFLAVELARAGIGHLTLVDHDSLEGANLFRHVLGRKHLCDNKTKAELLAKHIADNIPYMNVASVPSRIESAINGGTVDPSNFDLVVVALGDQTTELYLNRLAADADNSFPPLIFAWVEAYGIGWHVQVSNNTGNEGGCLECLYTNLPGDQSGLHCRASFAKAGQEFGQNISGCTGLFLPYGSTTAVHAALLAVETATNILRREEFGNPQLSLKGPSKAFTNAGFILTDRYLRNSNEDLFQQRYTYANPACAVCRGRQ